MNIKILFVEIGVSIWLYWILIQVCLRFIIFPLLSKFYWKEEYPTRLDKMISKRNVLFPFYQIYFYGKLFLFGDGLITPNILKRIKYSYWLFLDESYIRKDEFHYSLDSRYILYSNAFRPISFWVARRQEKNNSNPHKISLNYNHKIYLERLETRRWLAHREDLTQFQKNKLWWTYRLLGKEI